MNGERHTSVRAREWAVAALVALVALAAVYMSARSQAQRADAVQAAVTVRSMLNYMTPADGSQEATPAYAGDAVLYEASLADTFLGTDSARRLPDVSRHVSAARALFEEARRALADGAEWQGVSAKHESALAELDAAKRVLAEKYGTDIPTDFDLGRPK